MRKSNVESHTISPIRSFRLTNFRRFTDTGPINLAPVTMVLGRNSSGKTSLLRSMLLLKQLIGSSTFEDVPLAGPIVDFGIYRDLVFAGELSRDVKLEFDLAGIDPDSQHLPRSLLSDSLNRYELGVRLELTLHWNKKLGKPQFSEIAIAPSGASREAHVRFVRTGPRTFAIHFRDDKFVIPSSLSFAALRGLPLTQFQGNRSSRSKKDAKTEARRDYTIYILVEHISSLVRSIKYMGPLRDIPDRAYRVDQLSPESPTASVVHLLERQRNARAFMSGALREMSMARDVSLSRLAPGYVGIVLTDPTTGRVDNLTDVGFGVSQVLPVLASLASSAPNSTLLIEQPELHLHPRAQGRLMDVLSKSALAKNVSLVVETHSEHMLLRVMRRVAEEALAAVDVAVVMVDEGEVQTLSIDDLGRLQGGTLPDGFFEEDWEDSLKLAEAAAIRASRK